MCESWGATLAANAEFLDEVQVCLTIFGGDVLQEALALTDELQQPAAGSKIFFVDLEVLGELFDTLGKDTDLHCCATGVFLVFLQICDDLGFLLS